MKKKKNTSYATVTITSLYENRHYTQNHGTIKACVSWSHILPIINDLRSVLKGYFTKNKEISVFFYFVEHKMCFNRISRLFTKQEKVNGDLDCQAPNK